METQDKARECGIRLRQIRQSKGMSQQQLADLMHTTPQNISKWEKDGILNYNHICQLNDILGQDITTDQIDQEGTVGEVGKEILQVLVSHYGHVDFDVLLASLFGLSRDRVNNEIFKLERIGIVVREQFTDFLDNERDMVFITAKGLIAYKNSKEFPSIDLINKTDTMEMLLVGDEISIQEMINNDKVSKLLYEIQYYPYRLDYVAYLNRRFKREFPMYSEAFCDDPSIADLISGQSCFADLMFRMAKNIADDDFYDGGIVDTSPYYTAFDYDICRSMGLDCITANTQRYLSKVLDGLTDFDEIIQAKEDKYVDDLFNHYEKSSKESTDENDQELDDHSQYDPHSPKSLWKKLSPEDRNNCSKWFSREEILEYIDTNYILPSDKHLKEDSFEKRMDEVFREIWELEPSSLDYYYSFPDEWEENGLAQEIRDKFGVPKREPITEDIEEENED